MKPAVYRILLLLFGIAAPHGNLLALETEVDVKVNRNHETFYILAAVHSDAPPETVWQVLTDYEGQTRYVPGLVESKVLERTEKGSIVEQKGWTELLFFRIGFVD